MEILLTGLGQPRPLLTTVERMGRGKAADRLGSGFSDRKITIEDSVTEGDRVAIRFVITGIHTGPFMRVAPTGKTIRVSGTGIFKIVRGKGTDNWVNFDALGLLQQLSAAPLPKK